MGHGQECLPVFWSSVAGDKRTSRCLKCRDWVLFMPCSQPEARAGERELLPDALHRGLPNKGGQRGGLAFRLQEQSRPHRVRRGGGPWGP
jgi:hypothetical protein